MAKKTVKPVEPHKPPREDYAQIADAIGKVSDAAKAMRASGLSRDAAVVLIQNATGLNKRDIGAVLTAAEDLRRWCLTR